MSGTSSVRGFTLVELIAVIAIAGILAATATVSLLPSTTMQLQSSRDQVLTAFFSAQQRAMVQTATVSVVISAGNQVDVREGASSISVGGVAYPITLLPNQTLTSTTFTFDRLGKTSAASLNLAQSGGSVTINVSATGYAY